MLFSAQAWGVQENDEEEYAACHGLCTKITNKKNGFEYNSRGSAWQSRRGYEIGQDQLDDK